MPEEEEKLGRTCAQGGGGRRRSGWGAAKRDLDLHMMARDIECTESNFRDAV